MTDLQHSLELAKPGFLFFIKNMNPELCQYIQYNGIERKGDDLFFTFKSSENSLNFKVYAGENINNSYRKLKGKTNEIYDFFKMVKYNH